MSFQTHIQNQLLSRIIARSEIHWSDFHLGPLQGIVKILPVCPVQTITEWGGISVTIDSIQVGAVTFVVPPGSMPPTGTVEVVFVIIVLISSCKWLIAMDSGKRVASSSWDIRTRKKQPSLFIISLKSFLKRVGVVRELYKGKATIYMQKVLNCKQSTFYNLDHSVVFDMLSRYACCIYHILDTCNVKNIRYMPEDKCDRINFPSQRLIFYFIIFYILKLLEHCF